MLDSALRNDLTVDEALALGRRAILAAAHRDAFSGGIINCILITTEILLIASVSCHPGRMEIYWERRRRWFNLGDEKERRRL